MATKITTLPLLLLGIYAHTTDCPKYICQDDSVPFDDKTCVFYDTSIIPQKVYARPCRSGDCLPTSLNHTCQQPLLYKTKIYPGQKCENSLLQCQKPCVDGVCPGLTQGQTCTQSYQCNPGLRCASNSSQKTCQTLIASGSSGCMSNYDCQTDSVCNIKSSSAQENFCLPAFSVKKGEKIQELACGADSISLLCENLYCGKKEGQTFCSEPLASSSRLPTSCGSPQMPFGCSSTEDSVTGLVIEGLCTCGYNQEGQGYCGLYFGDDDGVKLVGMMKEWLQSTENSKNCNTERRLEEKCMMDWWDPVKFYGYRYYFVKFYYYPWTVDLKNCVRDTLFPGIIQ